MKGNKNDPMFALFGRQKKVIEINPNHPLIIGLLEKAKVVASAGEENVDQETTQLKSNLQSHIKLLYETALLHSGYELPNPAAFAHRVETLLRDQVGVNRPSPQETPEEEEEEPSPFDYRSLMKDHGKGNGMDDIPGMMDNINEDEETLAVLSGSFFAQDEFILIPHFFNHKFVKNSLVPEAIRLQSQINRSYIPIQKQGGSVSSYIIAKEAPIINSIYHNQNLMEIFKKITKEDQFFECPDVDPHGVALYYYDTPGDHISWHYDSSFYKGKRFTALVGLVDSHDPESCKLECKLFTKSTDKGVQTLSIMLHPGDLVLFNGDKVWHRVTPMTADHPTQQRIVLSLEYISDPEMSFWQRLLSNMKDAIAYFGFQSLYRGR